MQINEQVELEEQDLDIVIGSTVQIFSDNSYSKTTFPKFKGQTYAM